MPSTPRSWTFKFGEVLPHHRPDAQFVASIGSALNDLVFLNRLYLSDGSTGLMRRPPTEAESIYLIRQVASAVFELVRLLDKGRKDEVVRALLDQMDADGQAALAAILELTSHRPDLERIRNGTDHYPWPGDEALVAALTALRDAEGTLDAYGSKSADFRATFSDLVLLQLFHEHPDEDRGDEELRADFRGLLIGLRELTTAGIRLSEAVIGTYFAPLGALIRQTCYADVTEPTR